MQIGGISQQTKLSAGYFFLFYLCEDGPGGVSRLLVMSRFAALSHWFPVVLLQVRHGTFATTDRLLNDG
jgi:hypothetical protein